MKKITFHSLNKHSRFPEKAHESDAGWDVFFTGINHSDLIPTEHEFILLQPHQIAILGTGICATIPIGSEIQLRSRSGWASKGLIVVNGIGTIDANYRGEIKVIVSNVSNSIIQITKGSKIAQLVPCKLDKFIIECTKEPIQQNTDRGVSGFGDSDIMSIKQQVLTYLNKVESATLKDILLNIDTTFYLKPKHLSVIVSELVKEGKVLRIGNGLFKIKTKVQTNQIGLFI